jgi:hypothetical protein
MPPVLFALVYLSQRLSHFLPELASDCNPSHSTSCLVGVTAMCHHTQHPACFLFFK